MVSLNEFYEQLLRKTLWIRWNDAQENGYSALYLPLLAVLRRRPADAEVGRCIEKLLAHATHLYGVGTYAMAEMPREEEQLPSVVKRILERNPEITTLLFEGYAQDPAREGAGAHELIVRELSGNACEVLVSDLAAARSWISKAAFCERVESYYGSGAALPGVTLRTPTAGELEAAVRHRLAGGVGRVIVKRNGSGGSGNLIVEAGDDIGPRLEQFLSPAFEPAVDWVRVESWLDWDSSYCCSFFLRASGEPLHVALTQQVISPNHAALIGSRDMLDLDERDQEAVINLAQPLACLMQQDGIRGFSAVDVIVSKLPGWNGGPRLPSGRALRFVECNPRINRHNQLLTAVNRLAARDGYQPGDLAYLCLSIRPYAVTGDLQEMQSALRKFLDGISEPVTEEGLRIENVYYLIGPKVPVPPGYVGDVLFVGIRRSSLLQQMLAACEALRRANLLIA